MRLNVPKYHSKDFAVMVGSMLPMAILFNYFLLHDLYFSSWHVFAPATLVSFAYLSFAFFTYGLVAISLRTRFPEDRNTFKRILICLGIFYLMSAAYISLLLIGYDFLSLFDYQYQEKDFIYGWMAFAVLNTFLTFLNEGIYRYEKLRTTITETEQLKKEYLQSRLLGLKSQMNPHFLFNSLNTLSSLIHEDHEKAEEFLDHMSKVYRYLLRSNDEQLVPLKSELAVMRSYYFLLKERHGDGVQICMEVDDVEDGFMLPPMTLQMIVENALQYNKASRATPLRISIKAANQWLEISNPVQPKITGAEDDAPIWVNIANKSRLLCNQEIAIYHTDGIRTIRLPLIPCEKTEAV